MKTTHLEGNHCPNCLTFLNAASPLERDVAPKENDLSVCFRCGQLLKFNKDLKLVKLTDEELKHIKKEDFMAYETLIKTSEFIKNNPYPKFN